MAQKYRKGAFKMVSRLISKAKRSGEILAQKIRVEGIED